MIIIVAVRATKANAGFAVPILQKKELRLSLNNLAETVELIAVVLSFEPGAP